MQRQANLVSATTEQITPGGGTPEYHDIRSPFYRNPWMQQRPRMRATLVYEWTEGDIIPQPVIDAMQGLD